MRGGGGGAQVVLVTGGRGFVGRRLVSALARVEPGWTVLAPAGPVDADDGQPALDVTDTASVEGWIERAKPDVVVHLAALAAVTASVRDPRLAWRVNLDGTLNVVLALERSAPDAHLLYVSSAEVYGASFYSGRAADERTLLQPVNPYAASKASADILVRQAAVTGLFATVMRPFNHTGPGQPEAFVAPSFAGQIARIEAGLQEPVIRVGSLDEERDFLDVDDVVAAYVAVLRGRGRTEAGEVFNVASGQPVRIRDLLDMLLARSRVKIEVQVDPARLRRAPVPRVIGDADHLRRRLDWAPTISLDATLGAILEAQRAVILKDTSTA